MTQRRQFLASAMLAPLVARAQPPSGSWPSQLVRVLVGFPPGQGSDLVARILTDELQKTTGVPFIVDNRPGVGGMLAAGIVAKSAPDGNVLLFTSSGPFTISPHLYGNQGFDSITDLEGVAMVGTSPTLLVANPDFPANTIPELVRMSKERELDCGSSGYGITDHLTIEMLKLRSGARLNHVPYKGSSGSLADLVGRRLDLVFASSTSASAFVNSGRVKVLAVASATRWKSRPEVPAISETYPGFDASSWAMFAVPKGTPDAVRSALAAHVNRALANPAVVSALSTTGLEATPGTSASATKSYAVAEYQKWGEVIRKANIKIS
ncbi:Tat pathway signal sequence domain-containing protein 13 [Delftia sp. Cs1-4]|uniref:Bug family tripartite tricarboxylate transporter substrate binding protein n=1 Tax=Delftia sp. (strain Cs1-4) TaxID=742013 RepID=UPI00020E7D17|nr:tripartite tricarboxylate transporter substrate binding protein [Delftia sp. Cs1-4]AEF88655.1 Tat pathway signal sequence domain-containing protein 13 [Delftia sp. Cs1-4]